MRRVAVTGCGVVSPLGSDLTQVWQRVQEARPAFGPITRFNAVSGREHVVGEVQDFDPSIHFQPRDLEIMDRFAQFAVVASKAAFRDSGLESSEELSNRTGVLIGSGYGGAESYDRSYKSLYGDHAP